MVSATGIEPFQRLLGGKGFNPLSLADHALKPREGLRRLFYYHDIHAEARYRLPRKVLESTHLENRHCEGLQNLYYLAK